MRLTKRGGDPKRAIAYLRVSTTDQALGPDAQRAAIERWAVSQGVTVVEWHVDQGISGAAELIDRPALQAAIDGLAAHGAGVFVVAKRDRLARDVVLAALIERLAERHGARIVSAAGEGEGDDPSAMLMRRIVDAFSEYERALIRSRTKAALAVKKARGERTGTVPYGYRVGPDGIGLIVDLDETRNRMRVLALRAEGVSIRGIVSRMAGEGVLGRTGKPLCKTAVVAILR